MTTVQRTQQEIVDRIRGIRAGGDDFLGTQTVDLLAHVSDFALAKEFLKEDQTAETWAKVFEERTTELCPLNELRKYMPFALEKATGHRGISASRSLDHFRSWLWLLGDDDTLAFIDNDHNYPQYGMPCLKRICDVYELDFPDTDDARRMASGEPCGADYQCGCGM